MAEAHTSRSGEPRVYCDGRLLPAGAARVAADDHGLLFGLGFFETFRTCGGRPLLWPWHERRLRRACDVAGIALPPTFLARDEARLGEIAATMLADREMTDGVFRYTVTAGPGPARRLESGVAYTQPSELLTVRALPPNDLPEGIALRVLALRRDSGEWLPRPKSLNYANARLGAIELQGRARRADDEGLFLARDGGWVVEGVRHNVAWVAEGRWCYPDPAVGPVAGTALQWLLDAVESFAGEPRRASVDELARAEAVVAINSVRGIAPVNTLWDETDRVRVGSWESHAHPAVAELRRRWGALLRR